MKAVHSFLYSPSNCASVFIENYILISLNFLESAEEP